jgi:hypothetical protein
LGAKSVSRGENPINYDDEADNMSGIVEGFRAESVASVASALLPAFLFMPPGWTRLEPQSVSGDPSPGLQARLADPLWLLARQWQFGEFAAEDAGSPVAVHVASSTVPVDGWAPEGGTPRPLPAGDLIEACIEREPSAARGPTLRDRAEAGAELLAVLAACPLELPWPDDFDRAAPGLMATLHGRIPDGEAAAQSITGAAPLNPPPWLPAADPAQLDAIADWLAWYRSQVAPLPDPAADCWIDERLEYRFELTAGGQTFAAPGFGGGRVDWYDVDAIGTAIGAAMGDAISPQPPATATVKQQTVLATPLRFAGMPADRYWEFEDAQVNLGALEVQPHDLARLLLVEFATVYGNDWLVVPVDVPLGSFTSIGAVTYTTTFGEKFAVARADDTTRSGTFRLFELSVARPPDNPGLPATTIPGLFVPPSVTGVLDGPALEEVLYLRDELANMAWAVERTVQGPSGDPRSRHDEGYPPAFQPGLDPAAELDYVLQTGVPQWWIPFLPYSTGYATIALAKGVMTRPDESLVEPLGVLLRPGDALGIRDEEIPREGARVRRVPTLARRVDGSFARWITRRVTVGRGEGASGLAFDSTVARHPLPPE